VTVLVAAVSTLIAATTFAAISVLTVATRTVTPCCNILATTAATVADTFATTVYTTKVAANLATTNVVATFARSVAAAVVVLKIVARVVATGAASCCKNVAAVGDSLRCSSYCNYCRRCCCQKFDVTVAASVVVLTVVAKVAATVATNVAAVVTRMLQQ